MLLYVDAYRKPGNVLIVRSDSADAAYKYSVRIAGDFSRH